METKKEFGNKGENSAASFLCGKGYEILARNIKIGHTETDIVAKDKTNIIFVEVKTRRTYPEGHHKFGRPASAVNYKKKAKLFEGAKKYLERHADNVEGLQPRIDVIEVYIDPNSENYKVLKIIHMPNAIVGG